MAVAQATSREAGATKRRNPTEEAILECVIAMIDERGEAGVRIADITAATKASISSIYHFFHDREGLIAAAQAERYYRALGGSVEMVSIMASRATSRADLRSAILQLIEWMARPERAPHRLTRINVMGATLGRPVLRDRVAEIQDQVVLEQSKVYEDLQARGLMRSDVDPITMSAFVMGMILSRSVTEIGPSSASQEEWTRLTIMVTDELFFGDEKLD